MKLPIFTTKANKYVVGVIGYGIGYGTYYLLNHHPVFPTHYLPMGWVDMHVPLVPWTVWVYMSEYFYFAAVYIIMDNYDNINKYMWSYVALQLFSCLFFLFYPTVFPRENYPIPTDLSPSLEWSWNWLRTMDTAGNCFPSLHVSSVYLSAFVYLHETGKQKMFWFFFAWSTAIALSTLTTKQHYLVDIVSGLILAVVFYRVFYYKFEYQRIYPNEVAPEFETSNA